MDVDTILNIRYKIGGDRNLGSHAPMSVGPSGTEDDDVTQLLTFRSAIALQPPVLEPCLAVGFLPLPSSGLRVGQLFTMKWRVERLKYLEEENNVRFLNLVMYKFCPSLGMSLPRVTTLLYFLNRGIETIIVTCHIWIYFLKFS